MIQSMIFALTLMAFSTTAFADTDFENKLTTLLKNKPEIIYQALIDYQEKQKLAAREQQKVAVIDNQQKLKGDDLDYVANPEASLQLVEFFDYNCGYCKKAAVDVKKIASEKDNRVVFIEFPILGESSMEASRYAIAVKMMDGPYFEFHNALMGTQRVSTNVIHATLKDVGMDPQEVSTFLTENRMAIDAKVSKNLQLGQSLGIRGTPAFVAGEDIVPGLVPYAGLKALLARSKSTLKSKP